jgi:hypothetical protein
MSEVPSHEYQALAGYRHCVERMTTEWPRFLVTRSDCLRHGNEREKVAEIILRHLFTSVLDWSDGDLLYQEGHEGRADIVLSRNLAKYLVIEVKRPGTLRPIRQTFEPVLDQARRYATEQKVALIAASDGCYLYAADAMASGFQDRVFVDLSATQPPLPLWWLSMHGIYRPCAETISWPPALRTQTAPTDIEIARELLHPKYALPARCFAYVGDATDPATWKLPYLLSDGRPDERRLPKAIQALLSNYRGAKVTGIPECDLRNVLLRLAQAADAEGRMPPRAVAPAPVYMQLATVLDQLKLRSD